MPAGVDATQAKNLDFGTFWCRY